MDYRWLFDSPLKYDNEEPTIYIYYYDALMIIVPLVAGMCVSLPALIWACTVLYTLHKQGGRISCFIVLIVNDLVELILSAVIASYLIHRLVQSSETKSLKTLTDEQNESIESTLIIFLFNTFRVSGHYLHQLVALQSMLSLKKLLRSAYFFSPLCSTITCIILWLFVFGCHLLNIWIKLFFIFLPCCILAITCVLTYKASSGHIKPSLPVLIVSTLTLITFCATYGLVLALRPATKIAIQTRSSQFSSLLISLRVITDPVLCVLVSKEQIRVHKQQKHTLLNTEEINLS